MAEIQRTSPVPLYHQLREILRQEILEGHFRPGDRLPTEFELIARYQVSRTTVRQTIGALEREGLVTVRRGKGTFVRDGTIEPGPSALAGFGEERLAVGPETSARVVSIEEVRPETAVAERLGLGRDPRVVKLVRIRLAAGAPVSYDVAFLPQEIGAKLAEEDLVIDPLSALLEDKCGVPLGAVEYRIEASLADRTTARALGIEQGAAVLSIERTTYTVAGAPVAFEQLRYRGDKVRYAMRLTRGRPGEGWPGPG